MFAETALLVATLFAALLFVCVLIVHTKKYCVEQKPMEMRFSVDD
jgi:hypothetical protein